MTEEQPVIKEEISGGENVPTTSSKTTDYEMDRNPIHVRLKITGSKNDYVHIFRKPTFDEEEARERKMPLITSDAGKIDGAEASSMSIDDEPANVYLYDKLIQAVRGYAIKKGEKAHDGDISPDLEVDTPDGKKPVKELIPNSHKSTAISGMFPSTFKVEVEDEEDFTFALGGGREWRIKHEIGGRVKREDGTLSPPEYTIYYTFREAKESERKTFRTSAVVAVNLRDPKTNQIIERRSTNLKVIRDLFDALIVSIEGATVGGKPIQISNKDHLKMIPSDFKKGSIIKLFNALEADLGN